VVGPNEDKFVVHLDLLVFYSPYFSAALIGGFREAETKVITLKDEDPNIVKSFIHWLYHLHFPTEKDSAKLWVLWASSEDDDGQLTTENLVKTYIFSDMYSVRKLCNEVVTELYIHIETKMGTSLPNPHVIRHAFTNLDKDAPLLDYIVDAYCYFAHGELWEDFVEVDWHAPFVGRVLSRYTDCKGDHTPGPCHYHRHESPAEEAECQLDLHGQ
jgi:hypothetical protein